tara:strand:+ start:80 stop:385 length:306 start_codon:yes stop_codon:yes gene_type:complete
MAAESLLSYPFRIDFNNLRFGTVNSESDTYKAEQVSAFIRTEKGERVLFPEFGIDDPVFSGFDSGDFLDSFVEFYPSNKIEITEVRISQGGGRQDVAVSFN